MIWIIAYVLLGVVAVVLMAYDPFSQSFDFGLSGGWEFFWFQRYVLWLIIMVGAIYFLPKEIISKVKDRKYVKEWRTTGTFIKRIN